MTVKTEVMFKLLKLVKKTGIFQDLKSLFKNVNTKSKEELQALQEEVGLDVVIKLISNLDMAENEFYEVIASVKEIDIEQAKKLELDETFEILKAVFSSGAFKGFLSLLSK